MKSDNWKTIKEVLLEALRLDSSRRRDYLDQAGITIETREEVESLLAFEEEAGDFMSLSVSDFSKDFLDQSETAAEAVMNQTIGIYQIVSELGFGGMGAVYLARRTDGKFEQRVAIKMLKREFNTASIRRNFEREKQILASLSHPNVARLLDAGTTVEGIPYLVMEYIEGEPIDRFCQRGNLSLNERLKLFNKVCDTVAFAHRNLIVHRDLKPSNILVTKDGEPKLLDFGISKLLDAKADDANMITQLGALTPQYASPEQIEGATVTTATDVYSLGMVLFKVLTGSLPYDLGSETNRNLLREITNAAPTLPSEAATRRHGNPASSPKGYGKASVSPALSVSASELRGDLDNIVLKSLRKEPERRYQSVEQFSADIWRFVDGLPVIARKDTIKYRSQKFIRRNKVSVAAAALVVLALIAGLAVALTQAQRATVQARLAGEQRDAARSAMARAERTSRFMQSLLDYANPNWYARGKGRMDVTVREAIDDAATRIDTELAAEPEVRADIHYTVGDVYRTHGEHDNALRHFRQSLDLYRQVHGEQHPKVARGIYYVSLYKTDGEEAEALLRQAVAMMRQTDPENVNLPYMLQSLAWWITWGEKQNKGESRLAEAENLILEAKTLFIRHYGEDHGATITADSSLATVALTRGDLARAESMREEILRRYYQTAEGDHSYIWSLVSLAEVKLALGKATEAERLFGEALELGRGKWGADNSRFKELLRRISQARATASR